MVKTLGLGGIPIYLHEALNERQYGDLEGLDKAETTVRYGEEQVRIWRRSYATPPPGGESLRDTCDRVVPYFFSRVQPHLQNGQNVIVMAHGNSLRALVMAIEDLDAIAVEQVEVPTGVPLLYRFDSSLNVESRVDLVN